MDKEMTLVAAGLVDSLKWLLLGQGETAHQSVGAAFRMLDRRYAQSEEGRKSENASAREIEVTPEMANAGFLVLFGWDQDTECPERAAVAVYSAMERARRADLSRQT